MKFADIESQLVDFEQQPAGRVNRLAIEAMQDLCNKTWLYTEVLTFLTTAGTVDYSLSPSSGSTKIIGIPHDGIQIASVFTPQPSASDGTSGTLTGGNTYVYRVTAYITLASDEILETLPCAVVSHEAPAGGEISLSWDAISGADGYAIYRNDGAGSETYYRMTTTTDTSYDDDGTDSPDGSTEPPTTSKLMKDINQADNGQMKFTNAYWRQQESDGITGLIYDGVTSVRMNRVPETSGIGFQVEVALLLLDDWPRGTDLPTVFDNHKDTLLKFIRSRIFSLTKPDKDAPWYEPTLAKRWMNEYIADRNRIKSRKMLGGGGVPTRVKMQRFV